MNQTVLFADSSCDLTPALLEKWGIRYADLTFTFDGEDTLYHNYDLTPGEFYAKMRAGQSCKTAAVNNAAFEEAFEQILKEGNDVLYIGFSSGLSTTYHCAELAAEELRERYPERKILTVDSLSASSGYAMLLLLTARQLQQGAGIEQAASYAEKLKLSICHWFTVDELSYLTRGGRVANVIASVGGRLKIKPVMHMDNEGHLVPVTVARGRKNSLRALAERYAKLARTQGASPVYICHADCLEDAEYLEQLLRDEYGTKTDMIFDVGPVIGAHTGPGVVSLFFIGTER